MKWTTRYIAHSELFDKLVAAILFERQSEHATSITNFKIDLWTCIPTTTYIHRDEAD